MAGCVTYQDVKYDTFIRNGTFYRGKRSQDNIDTFYDKFFEENGEFNLFLTKEGLVEIYEVWMYIDNQLNWKFDTDDPVDKNYFRSCWLATSTAAKTLSIELWQY